MLSRTLLLCALALAGCDAKREAELAARAAEAQAQAAVAQRRVAELERELAAVQAELAAVQARAAEPPPPVTVSIGDAGALRIADAVVEPEQLQARLCALAGERPGLALTVAASPKSEHAQVVQVLDAARACKIEKVAITAGPDAADH